jgi:DNA-binding XRE family transcriptional regulator
MALTRGAVRPNGPEIRRLRQEQGIAPSALASTAGAALKTICNIENGSNGASPELLNRIATALSVTVRDISHEVCETAESTSNCDQQGRNGRRITTHRPDAAPGRRPGAAA